MPATIFASVGRNGANRNPDVRVVQSLLNGQPLTPMDVLVVDGLSGPRTIDAIESYQRNVLGFSNPDGRVDPGGRTLASLGSAQAPGGAPPAPPVAAPVAPPQPSTSFMERVTRFTNYVAANHGITVGVNSSTRQPLWQQRMHVAHMIKYNSYRSLKPRNFTAIGGHNLVSFAHLSSATLVWGFNLNASDYLRDATGAPCRKGPTGAWMNAPEETRTRQQAYELLKSNGIGTSSERPGDLHSAMVAPGVEGCAEPCSCGGGRSKHLSGVAVDLDRAAMEQLRAALDPPTNASVDALLGRFGLHRPMTSEPWHVESTD
jgi:peptidoglycan hydrolase-like protein with peptidoglycan-binding domain